MRISYGKTLPIVDGEWALECDFERCLACEMGSYMCAN